jgi:protein-L-isoaspartate(D-aspartate) O-methyltransferase
MATGSFPSADRATERDAMVREQIESRGIRDPAVLRAMRDVPRHAFVPSHLGRHAYDDGPLAIGGGQTISQPFVVAKMIEALELRPTDRVLEVGTGSGYAAAILARIVSTVFTVERQPSLRESAAERLARLGFADVRVADAGAGLGWPAEAPFDGILVSAGSPQVPPSLREQLTVGGRLVIPVGDRRDRQRLTRVIRVAPDDWTEQSFGDVSFVPLVGREAWIGG